MGWWPGPVLARLIPYSVAVLLIGLGLSQYSAEPALGLLNWLAVAASAALLLIAARLVYWAVAERVWGMSRIFHDGSAGVLLTVVVVCFLAGFFLLPLAGADPLGVVLRDWMAWRF
jgi:hypothetical protein